jgi:hydrogenase maturation protease
VKNGVLVIGIGNEFRGDDGAGIQAARRLAALEPPGVTVLEQSGEGATLMETWQTAATVFVVDAVQSADPPGTIYRFDAGREPLPAHFAGYSSHAFGLAEAVAMARLLGQLPARLIVYGVAGRNFDYGVTLSPEVETAVDRLVARLLSEVGT